MGQLRHYFFYFRPFLNTVTNVAQNVTINLMGIDGALGIRTRDRWKVGTNNSRVMFLHLAVLHSAVEYVAQVMKIVKPLTVKRTSLLCTFSPVNILVQDHTAQDYEDHSFVIVS